LHPPHQALWFLKERVETLDRNDPCLRGSGQNFQALPHAKQTVC